jgi:hypothetical protein
MRSTATSPGSVGYRITASFSSWYSAIVMTQVGTMGLSHARHTSLPSVRREFRAQTVHSRKPALQSSRQSAPAEHLTWKVGMEVKHAAQYSCCLSSCKSWYLNHSSCASWCQTNEPVTTLALRNETYLCLCPRKVPEAAHEQEVLVDNRFAGRHAMQKGQLALIERPRRDPFCLATSVSLARNTDPCT